MSGFITMFINSLILPLLELYVNTAVSIIFCYLLSFAQNDDF